MAPHSLVFEEAGVQWTPCSLERARVCKDSCTMLLALDWASAFDSTAPEALARALRFGLTDSVMHVAVDAYPGRMFFV